MAASPETEVSIFNDDDPVETFLDMLSGSVFYLCFADLSRTITRGTQHLSSRPMFLIDMLK